MPVIASRLRPIGLGAIFALAGAGACSESTPLPALAFSEPDVSVPDLADLAGAGGPAAEPEPAGDAGPTGGGSPDARDVPDVPDVPDGGLEDVPGPAPEPLADTGSEPDPLGGDTVVAADADADLDIGAELDGGDAVPDVPDPDAADVPDPPSGTCFSAKGAEKLCEDACEAQADCGVSLLPPGGGCAESCVEQLDLEPHLASNLICLTYARGNAETPACDNVEKCLAPPAPPPPDCEPLCTTLDLCESGADAVFGADLCSCTHVCGALALLSPSVQSFLVECSLDVLEGGCTDGAGVLCLTALQQPTVCAGICDRFGACGAFPGLFPDAAACALSCETLTPGKLVATNACSGVLSEKEGCYDPASCVPPPAAPSDAAKAFCEAAKDLCGALALVGLPSQIDVCAWTVEGSVQVWAGIDLEAAAECAGDLEVCPKENPQILYNCIAAWPPCEDYCETVAACGFLPEGTDQAGCMQLCGFGHLENPVSVEAIAACVDEAGGCGEVAACFDGP